MMAVEQAAVSSPAEQSQPLYQMDNSAQLPIATDLAFGSCWEQSSAAVAEPAMLEHFYFFFVVFLEAAQSNKGLQP